MALQMASTEGSGPPDSPIRRLSPRGGRRLAAQGIAVVLFVGGGLWGTLWWQERPIRLASSQLQAGQRDAAYETISQFLHDHPDHHRALAIKARILVEEGRPQPALDIFDRVGASEPQDMHAVAKALLHQERWSQALPLLEFVETTGIDRADVLYELAACRMKLGAVDQALEAADEFAKQPGFEARGELLKGTIHQQRGNLRLAAASWDRVLKLSPEIRDLQIPAEEFFLEYGRVLLAMGESALAETNIQRSLKIRQTPDGLVSLAQAQFQLGKAQEARQAFESALSGDPYSVAARNGLAGLYLSEGQADKSVELLAPLETSGVLTSEVAFLLQRSYARLKNESEAKRWQEKAEQLRKEESLKAAADQILRETPDSDWATVIRAYKYANQGNWVEAESLLRPLEQPVPSQPFIRDLIAAVKMRGPLPSLTGLPVRDH
jgi:predicted Zn-dependent protease